MESQTRMPGPSSQAIALVVITYGVVLTMFAFFVGRNDGSIRTAVVLCITSLVSNLVGIGSGILVGGGPPLKHGESSDVAPVDPAGSGLSGLSGVGDGSTDMGK